MFNESEIKFVWNSKIVRLLVGWWQKNHSCKQKAVKFYRSRTRASRLFWSELILFFNIYFKAINKRNSPPMSSLSSFSVFENTQKERVRERERERDGGNHFFDYFVLSFFSCFKKLNSYRRSFSFSRRRFSFTLLIMNQNEITKMPQLASVFTFSTWLEHFYF